MYITSQIFAFLAFIISLLAFHKKTKKKILLYMILSSIFNFFHYLFLLEYSACITKILAIIRDTYIVKKDKQNQKSNIFLYIFIILYIVSAIITFKGIYSILPLLAALIYLIVIYNGDELQIKRISYITYFIWLSYNICVFSVVGIISNIVSIISSYIAYYNYKHCK